jgi:hypothetical protein
LSTLEAGQICVVEVIPSLLSSPVQSFFGRALLHKLFEGNGFPTFEFSENQDNRHCTLFSHSN